MAESKAAQFVFPFSLCALSALLFSVKANSMKVVAASLLITIVFCFVLGIWLIKKQHYVNVAKAFDKSPIKKQLLFFSILVGMLLVKNCILLHPRVLEEFPLYEYVARLLHLDESLVRVLIFIGCAFWGLVALPAILLSLQLISDYVYLPIKNWLRSLTKVEATMICVFTLSIALLAIISAVRNPIFLYTIKNGEATYDGVFGADSSYLVYYDYFASPVLDDLRHPLMGIISLPFSLAAWVVAIPVYVISFFSIELLLIYSVCLSIVQAAIVAISVILLCRISREWLGEKFSLLLAILLLCSFPVIFYSLIIERYAFSFFYLMVFLYLCNKKESSFAAKLTGYILAVGAIFTTAILLPLLFFPFKDWSKKIKWLFGFGLLFILVTGHLTIVLASLELSGGFLEDFASLFHPTAFAQYLIFLRSMLIGPSFVRAGLSIDMADPVESLSILTVAVSSCVFIGAMVGAFLQRKKRMIKVAFCWVLFSVLLLFVIGLGAVINEMALYSLYFNWAFLLLIVSAVAFLFQKLQKAGMAVCILLSCGALVYNLLLWANMMSFISL